MVLGILSFITYIFSNGRYCVPEFVWIYPMFFLFLLQTSRSLKSSLVLFGICAVGFVIQFKDVIGMGLGLCIGVAILISGLKILPYIIWFQSKRDFKGTITFAAAMTVVEYIIYCIYPILGGLSEAYTQYRNPVLLQITTITGIYGIIFMVYWTAAIFVWLWGKRGSLVQEKRNICVYCGAMCVIFLYGTGILLFSGEEAQSVRIAGVTVPVSELLNEDEDVYAVFYTDSFSENNLINTKRKLANVTEELFAKTVKEAEAGAKIVFWSELNGAVMKEDEEELLKRASDIAKDQDIYLIVSLLVKTPYVDLKENKTVAFNPKGELISEYLKHGRSLGELCIQGDGEIKCFDTEYGRIAPFICSDMAFTSNIRQAGKNNVDILIVPASDWKEMTDIAIRTAVVRGVENGCNVVRHTNRGKSIASDTTGDIRFLSDYFQSDTKTLTAQIATSGRFTIYSYIGNCFVYFCICFLVVAYKKKQS